MKERIQINQSNFQGNTRVVYPNHIGELTKMRIHCLEGHYDVPLEGLIRA